MRSLGTTMLVASAKRPRATGADAEVGRRLAERRAEAEAAAAETEVPRARGAARGEEKPMTGDEEVEDAQEALGDCGGDVRKSVKVLYAEKLGDRTYDTVIPWCEWTEPRFLGSQPCSDPSTRCRAQSERMELSWMWSEDGQALKASRADVLIRKDHDEPNMIKWSKRALGFERFGSSFSEGPRALRLVGSSIRGDQGVT